MKQRKPTRFSGWEDVTSKSQSSLEYLLVMGVAIFILVAAISYAIYYQAGYNSAGSAQDLQLAATSIYNAVSSVSTGGIGSSQQFSFTSPGLDLTSSICNTSISFSHAGEEASQSLPLYTTGEIPLNPGTYTASVKLVKKNGKIEAQLSMQLPISYISTSYIDNPSSIFYNVSFLDTAGNLVGNVNFTIIIYTDNKIVAEQNETTISGFYSGSVKPTSGQFASNSVAEIYVSSLGIISPSCFLPQRLLIVPSNVLNYIPITITNNQGLSTPSPFQQMVTIDSADYQQYEASNLQNVEFFYPNGTVINSWLESGNSNTATSAVYWLKLPAIPAHSSFTIYMGFAPKNMNLFNNTNDGEAPQLSSTYAEYDDGASVFNFYDNFAGSSLSSKWINGGSGTNCGGTVVSGGGPGVTVNNGLYISTDSSTDWAGIVSQTGFTPPVIFETDTLSVSGVASGIALTGADNLNTEMYFFNFWASGFADGTIDDGLNNLASPDIHSGITGIAWVSSSSQAVYQNYVPTAETQTALTLPSQVYPIIGIGDCSPSSSISVQWVRVRAYPPDGVMPSVSIGTVQPQITVFVNGVKDGNNGIASDITMNITAFGIHASHIGLMINGSIVVPLGSASLSYQKTMSVGLYNITVFSNQSDLANQTYWEAVANIPKGITNFVPISITNLQSSATSSPFQQNISIDSFGYHSFENQSLNNIEFFSPSGSTIPSWLESGDIAYFNGNSYSELPENYPFSMASSFTISVWFKTTSDGIVISNGNNAVPGSSSCYSPTIYVNDNGDLAGGDWTGSQPFNTNYFVANGKWNQVTITQTPTEQILYLNGNEIASYSYSSVQSCSPTYWAIGSGHSGWDNTPSTPEFNFTGYISNFQFYNQVFTPTKAALLYDGGVAGSPLNNSGLIAWYLLSGNVNQQNGHNTLSTVGNLQFNGVSSASKATDYWVKLGEVKPRESYILFMGFALPNISLFNNTNDGEAPQLSATYGEYDDGANVFLEYGDFLGTAGFDGWTPYITGGSFSPTPSSNGIEMTNDSGSEGTHVLPPNPLPMIPVVVEYSWDFYGGTSPTDGEILSLFGNTNSLVGAPVVTCGGGNLASDLSVMLMVEPVGMNCSGKYLPAILDSQNNKIISTVNNLPSTTPQTYTEELIVANSNTAYAGVINESSSLVNFSSINIPLDMSGSIPTAFQYPTLMVAAGTGGGYDYNYLRWVIARSYPPNGIMPTETVGYLNGQAS